MCIRDRPTSEDPKKFDGIPIDRTGRIERIHDEMKIVRIRPVSYTHLDVYKRQHTHTHPKAKENRYQLDLPL